MVIVIVIDPEAVAVWPARSMTTGAMFSWVREDHVACAALRNCQLYLVIQLSQISYNASYYILTGYTMCSSTLEHYAIHQYSNTTVRMMRFPA